MSQTHNVAVLVGSLRKDSINRKVAEALVSLAPSSMTFTFVEIRDLPLYNQDADANPPVPFDPTTTNVPCEDLMAAPDSCAR